jgi:hypothetical protein
VQHNQAIAACARMAGSYLFRSFDLHLPGVLPGQAVLAAEATEQSPMLLRVAAGILANLGIIIAGSPADPVVDEKFKPLLAFLETQRLLEPLFSPIQSKYSFGYRHAAQAAAIGTALLIHHFARHLEPNIAFGLAAYAFVEGSQTAPDPVHLVSNPADPL